MVQIRPALPIATAENLSANTGALNAIAEASRPTRLKRIKSIKTFGSGKASLKIKWEKSIKVVIHFKIEYLFLVFTFEF